MTDTLTTAPVEPPAPSSGAISDAHVEAARQTWAKAGLDPAKFEAALAPKAPPAPPGAPVAGDTEAARIQATVDALRASGLSAEAIEATLARHGLKAPADPRTDAERKWDATFGVPAPTDYRPSYQGRVGNVPDLAGYHQEATQWAASMALPVTVGEYVIERVLEVGDWYGKASEAERTAWRVEERASMVAKFGEEGAQGYIARAAQSLALAPAPFTERLRLSGALHSAEIVRHLALNGARLARRAG